MAQEWLEGYLRQRVPELLSGRPPVQAILPLAADVWRVECADGQGLVAKHQLFGQVARGTAHDLLAVERQVLEVLRQAGCPVPAALGIDPETQFIFLECGGDCTLDDVAQEGPPELQRRSARQTVAGFCAIDRVFRARQEELRHGAAPGADPEALARGWEVAGRRAEGGLAQFLPAGFPHQEEARQLLRGILDRLADRPLVLGSTDYNARNVVVDLEGGAVRFIEFAKIGWDWPERRLVQYATSLGGGRANGTFRGLLDREGAGLFAAQGGEEAALDGHQLVFLLNAAALLGAALERPREEASQRLLAAWQNPVQRLARLRAELAAPLSDEPLAGRLREMLGDGRWELSCASGAPIRRKIAAWTPPLPLGEGAGG